MSTEKHARRYAIISGKGGVGKSVITANLAAAFAEAGQRTLVIDADLGLANIDVLLGENPAGSIQDILAGDHELDEVVVRTRAGFDLLPAGSGVFGNGLLTPVLADRVTELLRTLDSSYDSILIDAGAGIGEVVLFFARMADEIVLVVTPEPTSLMDAYATIKILALRHGRFDFRLVVNQTDPSQPEYAGIRIAGHLQQVVSKFLSAEGGSPIRLHFTGSLPKDPAVCRSIRMQRLLVEVDPKAAVASMMPRLAESLRAAPVPSPYPQ
jgi:flagellar biosynthesis protein FlhG